ncbi:MAG: DUF3987 domain-containing protein [Chitinophagales bacterium]|nr:DUF3987 domain-containing protein [Chitinophagales bacterium]
MTTITKEKFLEYTDGGFSFYKMLIPELELSSGNKCKPVHNPLYSDNKPGLSIYFDEENTKWRYKDHGHSPSGEEYSGDVFDFAASYYNLDSRYDFALLLNRMSEDLNLNNLTPKQNTRRSEKVLFISSQDDYFNGNAEDYYAWLVGFQLEYNGENKGIDEAYEYFKKFGITKDVLRQYNVRSISSYKYVHQRGFVANFKVNTLTIAFENCNFAKLYSPFGVNRFFYVGTKTRDYVFGRGEIMRRLHKEKRVHPFLIITGGEKDVLTLTALGYDAICFNSETANTPKIAIEELFPLYDRILIIYDLDETGIKRSKVLNEFLGAKFNVSIVTLPNELKEKGGKDVSDYVALGMDIQLLREIIEPKVALRVSSLEDKHMDKADKSSVTPIIRSELGSEYFPNLPAEVYHELPESIQSLCSLFSNSREKDLILLSTLVTISSFFPNVNGIYGRRRVGCNLFLFVSAPASSGKGVIMFSRVLGDAIQSHLKEEYEAKKKKWISDTTEYNSLAKNNSDVSKPEEPKQQVLFIPANSSVSMIIQLLDTNKNFGVIFETEGDTLTESLATEWGGFSDVLRKVFHHETISMARRGNSEYLQVHHPQLSVVLSGTEKQVNSLIKDVENGFFSRMLFYTFREKAEWRNQFAHNDNTTEEIFKNMSQQMLEYWLIQDKTPCTIKLNELQINQINSFFTDKLQQFYLEHGDAITPSIKRLSLIFYRISMILSTIRCLDETKTLPKELYVTRNDFQTAFCIVKILMVHLQTVYERMGNATNTIRLKAKQRELFESLPRQFDRSEYNLAAERLRINQHTAERYIGKFIQLEIIDRYEHGKYKKM